MIIMIIISIFSTTVASASSLPYADVLRQGINLEGERGEGDLIASLCISFLLLPLLCPYPSNSWRRRRFLLFLFFLYSMRLL